MLATDLAWAAGVAAVGYQGVPSLAAIGPLRRVLLPRLAGISAGHVALTFDDGPSPDVHSSTRRSSWSGNSSDADVGRELVARGHKLAVHGWSHCRISCARHATSPRDVCRGYAAIVEVAGAPPRYWRPPHGIPIGRPARRAAARPPSSPVVRRWPRLAS